MNALAERVTSDTPALNPSEGDAGDDGAAGEMGMHEANQDVSSP